MSKNQQNDDVLAENNPAFPVVIGTLSNYSGLSKREYAAIHILQGMIPYQAATKVDEDEMQDRILHVIQCVDLLFEKLEDTKEE